MTPIKKLIAFLRPYRPPPDEDDSRETLAEVTKDIITEQNIDRALKADTLHRAILVRSYPEIVRDLWRGE